MKPYCISEKQEEGKETIKRLALNIDKLRTMRNKAILYYRNQGVIFRKNMIPESLGIIKVGDKVSF